MKLFKVVAITVFALMAAFFSFAQDSAAYKWQAGAQKISDGKYRLHFSTEGAPGWQLFAPAQVLSEVPMAALAFNDSSIVFQPPFQDSGVAKNIKSSIFENAQVKVFFFFLPWLAEVQINGEVPAKLQGKLTYSYGSGDEFYQGEHHFNVALEGGTASQTRILIPSIDVKNPVSNCGDTEASGKGLGAIFLLGFVGGLIALITPCVFPLIPLTVSFFTKKSGSRRRAITNALLYGLCIFGIYVLLSLPFYLLDSANPEILNSISTNATLNLIFFAVFIVFALSFFGLFEITLPGSFASKMDARSGIGNFTGIFFMALTLAIVSFSCTGPILGSLLAGALTNNGGAVQLTAGMSGFGLGLALPFVLFALFPQWLHSLPKSGGWLTTVKVVFGFLELAMAVKFLSNADLVKQWGILPREVFIGIWIVIGLLTVLYLLGVLRSKGTPRPKLNTTRWAFTILFAAFTLYLLPGITNTKAANLSLISGFPPPLCYSVFKNPINCVHEIEPIKNDYALALQKARDENKPVLIDFTGWACVNCRRMEEKVWTDAEVARLMQDRFIVVSLYVDERRNLPAPQQTEYTTKAGDQKSIVTVGDLWATFQSENFYAVAQPQYAIISPDEKALTRTKAYTPNAQEFKEWLECGLEAFEKNNPAQ